MSKEQLMFLKLSPKSKEALDRSGLLFTDLVFPTLDMFEKLGKHTNPLEVAEILRDVVLNARENKFKLLKQEYQTVCKLEKDGQWPAHGQTKAIRPKSAMIDKEMADLEKIKRKQQ